MTFLGFSRNVLAGTLALLLAVAGFNLAIDPYGLYGFAVEGVNARKPESRTHILLAKQQRLIHAQPETVILGNSRADLGLDPESPYWPEEFGTVFNFAIPGEEMYGTVQRYDNARRFRVLVLELQQLQTECSCLARAEPPGHQHDRGAVAQ